jgi:hypothetical protein
MNKTGSNRAAKQVRRERNIRGRWSTSSNAHATAIDGASEESDTQKITSEQTTHRVPQPGCTGTKSSLGFIAVRLSPQESKKCGGRTGYEHTRAWARRIKERQSGRYSTMIMVMRTCGDKLHQQELVPIFPRLLSPRSSPTGLGHDRLGVSG